MSPRAIHPGDLPKNRLLAPLQVLADRFVPNTFTSKVFFVVLALFLFSSLSSGLFSAKGFWVTIELILIYVLVTVYLPRWLFEKFSKLPAFVQKSCCAAVIYGVCALIGNAMEIVSLRSVGNHLLLSQGAPFTGSHLAGVVVAGLMLLPFRISEIIDSIFKSFGSGYLDFYPKDEETVIRGSELISFEEAKRRADALPGEAYIKWGGLMLPDYIADQNFLIVGSAGSGKTLCLRILMQSVLMREAEQGTSGRAIIFDAKRDTMSLLGGISLNDRVLLLNPFDRRGVAWNLAKDIKEGTVCHQLATILFPVEPGARDSFFQEAAQDLFGGVVEAFADLSGERWTLRDVVLALRTTERTKAIISKCESTKYLAEKWLTGGKRNEDVDATIQTKMKPLSFVAAAWDEAESSIGLTEWLESDKILVLGTNPNIEAVMMAINRVIFARVTDLLLAPGEREARSNGHTWFFIDELRRLGKLDSLSNLLVEGRSKGARVAAGFQDVSGFWNIYNENEGNEIIGECKNKIFLQTGDQVTAEYASKHFGDQDVEKTKVSRSENYSRSTTVRSSSDSHSEGYSVSTDVVTRRTVSAGEFSGLSRPIKLLRTNLEGYCDINAAGSPYKMVLGSDELGKELIPGDAAVPDLEPREEKPLRPWTRDDLERLGLPDLESALIADGNIDTQNEKQNRLSLVK